MLCPKCKSNNTRVLDSRETDGHKAVRRRRACEDCENRFTTFERVETNRFLVIKKDGAREGYNREKLERGVLTACEKRKVSHEQITEMIIGLEEIWSNTSKEVESTVMGEDVMNALKELDEVAYIRFASVYKHFKDIDSFKKELDKLFNKS